MFKTLLLASQNIGTFYLLSTLIQEDFSVSYEVLVNKVSQAALSNAIIYVTLLFTMECRQVIYSARYSALRLCGGGKE